MSGPEESVALKTLCVLVAMSVIMSLFILGGGFDKDITEKSVLTSEIVFGDPVMTTTFKKQDRLPQTCP